MTRRQDETKKSEMKDRREEIFKSNNKKKIITYDHNR
jgi:hypothetical protein